jgi:hypothetical protein
MKKTWHTKTLDAKAPIQELFDFCEKYPVAPYNLDEIPDLTAHHVKGLESIIELYEGDRKKCICVTMDKSQNQLMSLEVIFIGGERLNHDGSVVLLESLLKGARDLKYKSLEIFWTEGHPLAQSYLELQNFEVLSKTVEIYGTSEQGERVIEQLAPPSDFKFVWQDFKEEQFESFFAMYREIFIDDPQYSFKDPQEFKRSLLQGVPPLRVLMDGKIIVGFVLVFNFVFNFSLMYVSKLSCLRLVSFSTSIFFISTLALLTYLFFNIAANSVSISISSTFLTIFI